MKIIIFCLSDLFTRSVKVSTGTDIDPYVIDVIFKLFDQDGMSLINHKLTVFLKISFEFISGFTTSLRFGSGE